MSYQTDTHTTSVVPKKTWLTVLVCSAVLSVFIGPLFFFAIVLLCIGYSVYLRPQIGLFVMVLLTPCIGLEFRAQWLAPYVAGSPAWLGFYAPLVDAWTFFFLVVYMIRLVREYLSGHARTLHLPGFGVYLLFLSSAVVSVVHLPGPEMIEGLKYLIRFPLFVYVGYIVLGINVMTNKETLYRALQLLVGMGVFTSILGLVSLFVGAYNEVGLHRAVPVPVFGIDMFNFVGDVRFGHILLAEFLTIALPIAVYLAYHARTQLARRYYVYASILIGCVCVLTFSRAGWVTLVFQAMLFIFFFYKQIPWRRLAAYVPIGLLIAAVPVGYMILFLQSSIVSSSNSARLALSEIGWYLFLEWPIFGQGVGMFTTLLDRVGYFTYQFGDAIDAHSIVTKISAEQGIVGLVAFGLFISWILSRVYARMKNDAFSLEARMAALLSFFLVSSPLFFQLFNTQYYSARMWVPLLFAIALSIVHAGDRSSPQITISFIEKLRRIKTDI